MSDDEFDNIPDEFSGIDFDCIHHLAPQQHTAASSNPPSPHFSDDEKYDDAFFRELDMLEQAAQVGCAAKPSPERPRSSKRPLSSPASASTRRTTKRRKDLKQALERMEDEITCAICCDLFVAAHLGNPCGHTFCGECGWQWITKNMKSPTCAICRTALFRAVPIIPNIAVDNTVEKHIEVLASNGDHDWKPGGCKMAERTARRVKWKEMAAERAAHPQKMTKRRGRNVAN